MSTESNEPVGQQGAPAPRPAGMPPASFDLTRLTTVDKVVAGATLITMISIWLPFYTVSSGIYSVSLSGTFHTWMWLEFLVALVLIAYLAARALWDRLPFAMPVAHGPLLLVGTSLQLLLILIALIAIPYSDQGMGLGWAAFLGLLAALAAAGPLIVPAVRRARGGSRSSS
jgi:hypothetical protein